MDIGELHWRVQVRAKRTFGIRVLEEETDSDDENGINHIYNRYVFCIVTISTSEKDMQ